MAVIDIQVNDRAVRKLLSKLDKLGKIEETMGGPMDEALQLIYNEISPYPPPPAQSRYRRTYTLGRRWQKYSKKINRGIEGHVTNDTIYAQWVQHSQYQTAVHRATGWKTDEQVAMATHVRVQSLLERGIERIIEG